MFTDQQSNNRSIHPTYQGEINGQKCLRRKKRTNHDAWGNVLTATGNLADVNPLRYRGYYFDIETGFYYLQSRYYDPIVKRFLNADAFASTGQGFLGYNMFAYCGNNPIIYADYSGRYCVCVAVSDGGGSRSPDPADPENDEDDDNLVLIVGSEHHKRGTTNEANRKKHEKGQGRKKRDAGGEKGDKRRRRYRNGFSYQDSQFVGPLPDEEPLTVGPTLQDPVYDAPAVSEYDFGDYCWEGAKIVGCGIAIICLYADDVSGCGVADNAYADYLTEIVSQSWAVLFG